MRTSVTDDWANPVLLSSSWATPARWSLLEAPDLLRYLRGAKEIGYHARSLIGDQTFTEILGPHSCLPWWENAEFPDDIRWEVEDERKSEDYPCYVLLKSILSRVVREVSPGVRDPLKALKECKNYWSTLDEPEPYDKNLCIQCDNNLREWIPKARGELWRRLPEYFEVPAPTA